MTQSIGPIDLVMRHLGKDFKEACRWLADEHNIILDEWKPAQTDEVQKPFDATRFERFFERPWLLPEARKFLFDERRIDPRVVLWCRLTYNLPVLNLLKPGEQLFITEGCSDCWAMLSAGHKAIAIPSATLLSKKDKEILSTLHSQLLTKFEMWPDNDAPGERLFLQLQEVLPSLVRHQLPVGCKDYSDYYVSVKRKEADHG